MTWCDDSIINGLFSQVNTYRSQNGVSALQMDPLGMKDAEIRATQFAAYMQTNPPGSPGFNPHQGYDTTAASLGYNIISENLAYMTSDPSYIVFGVWQDTLHRAAMLASDANVAGVSCVYFNGIPYSTYEPGKASGSPAPAPVPPPSTDDQQAAFLTLINNYRAQNGAGALQISPTLQAASTWMSNDMATNNYASHTDSLGRSVGARLAAFGYTYSPYGENIAGGFGDAQTVFNQWVNACDPDASGTCTYAHRINMLNPSYKAIGIGRTYNANSAYGWYWTTDFGAVLDTGAPPGPSPSPAPAISSFTATPSAITAGQTATLSWSVSGATTISIDNGVGDVSALTSKAVSPTQTTTYRLTATNSAGSASAPATVTVTAAPAVDAQPPTVPVLNSAIAKSQTQIDLAWSASTDNIGVAGYQIVRNGSPVGTVGGSSLAYTDSTAAASTTYAYAIRAFDAAGNYSAASNSVQVTTPAPPVSSTCPGPAQDAFTGCYYNNTDLSGTPALVRTDSQINFDWMYTSPDKSVPGPAYSIRWQGSFQFDQGTYTFTAIVSDGIRVYIDGTLVLDRWRDQPVYFYTVQQTLSQGRHLIGMEYYERTGTPSAHLSWQNNSPSGSAPTISSFTATPSAITAGQSATLAWAISGASTVSIDNNVGDVSNVTSKSVSPAQTTTYKVTAANSGGSATAVVTITVNPGAADTQPPTTPAITSITAKAATQVDLAWSASTDNIGVAGYQIVRNGSALTSVPAATLVYSDSTAAANTTYNYSVRAFDAGGNYSSPSASAAVMTPAAAPASSCAPATGAFTGCYYNNTDLTGTPVLIRTDNQINFDWTFAPPDPAVPAVNYSVRWQGNISFDAGIYTFYATTSDGMRIYIDGALVLDRWRDQPAYTYTIRQALSQGSHLITVEYYERTGNATAHMSWQKN
jgi:uncharacterized protein YkwD/single-stranded DNA-binding protein